MDLEEMMLALVQGEVDVTPRVVMESRSDCLRRGIRFGVAAVQSELDRRYGFRRNPAAEERLRQLFPESGDLPLRLLRRLKLPAHVGREGETAADVLRPAGVSLDQG